MSSTLAWPAKTRELHNHHFDSTVWNDFAFRDDDVIVATYAKSGTTWTQQIVGQLIFDGDPGVRMSELSPWVDLRVPAKAEKLAFLEAQTHRRFVKTHLPLDALVFSPKAKYLYIGRDGRDVIWSMHNHHVMGNALWYELVNDTPGRVGPPLGPPKADVHDYFRDWLAGDGFPFWSLWENVRSWWAIRDLPNVMLIHFEELKRDLPDAVRRIAAFLEIPLDGALLERVLLHSSFDWMKQHAAQVAPLGGACWDGGGSSFINRGTNGRWRDTMPEEDRRAYEAKALGELGPECAAWLATGEVPATLPAAG